MNNDDIGYALVGEGRILEHVITLGVPGVVPLVAFSDDLSARCLKYSNLSILPGSAVNTGEGLARLEASGTKWLFSVNNFAHLISRTTLALFGSRALNVHYGILPEYAGRHAYQWAIRNGEPLTGVTVHEMTFPFDSGNIVAIEKVPILSEDTGLSIFKNCSVAALRAIKLIFREISAGISLGSAPQDISMRVAYREQDAGCGKIDWHRSAVDIRNFVRAANFLPFRSPTYTAWFSDRDGAICEVFDCAVVDSDQRYKIGVPYAIGGRQRVNCGIGAVEIIKGKPAAP